MFGLGATEIILILLVLILLFGARKLPDLARGLGRSVVEFRKGMRGEDEEKHAGEEKKNKGPQSG